MTDLGKFVDAKIAQAKAKQVICPECGGADNGYGTCLCFSDEEFDADGNVINVRGEDHV